MKEIVVRLWLDGDAWMAKIGSNIRKRIVTVGFTPFEALDRMAGTVAFVMRTKENIEVFFDEWGEGVAG